jgi:ligand-binding SRPBCC domain-containing protein
MPQFSHAFDVKAAREAVLALHHDPRALHRLTPPPLFVQLHCFEPLAEGSLAEFTLWFGPIPVGWRAVHAHVSDQGFTDTQETGPLRRWRHRHQFQALDAAHTRILDEVTFEYEDGLKGLFTRLVFNRPGLLLLFTFRKWATRWHLRSREQRSRTARLVVILALMLATGVLFRLSVRQGD